MPRRSRRLSFDELVTLLPARVQLVSADTAATLVLVAAGN
jgi:hypothetical protein